MSWLVLKVIQYIQTYVFQILHKDIVSLYKRKFTPNIENCVSKHIRDEFRNTVGLDWFHNTKCEWTLSFQSWISLNPPNHLDFFTIYQIGYIC
jgi:hypothetical protein